MKLNFCRFIRVMNDGPYTCYKTEVFFLHLLLNNDEHTCVPKLHYVAYRSNLLC